MNNIEKYIRACIGLSLAYETYHESILQRDFTEKEREDNARTLKDWLIEYKRSKNEIKSIEPGTEITIKVCQ